MSATETGTADALDPGGRPTAAAEQDPTVSPAETHADPEVRFTVPTVIAARAGDGGGERVRERVPERGSGVKLASISRTGDRVFGALAGGSGVVIVGLVVFVGVFLLALALPALLRNQDSFLTSRNWVVVGNELRFGIAGLLWTTVLSSVIAMVLAVPVAVGVALFLTQYAPKRLSGPLSFVVDLLAAVPSIIFGLWGLTVLGPFLDPAGVWISKTLGFIPLFANTGAQPKNSVFVASIVLAIMILPIVTAISRDVFAQTPRDHIEAAFALGATRWEMIRKAVMPYGRSGVISASMLGLGRALGETVAVLIILSTPAAGSKFSPSIFAGGETFASKIANNASEFDTPSKTGAFIAAGLVLFVVTFVVNALARVVADRGNAKA